MRKLIIFAILFLGCTSKMEFKDADLTKITINQYIYSKDGVYTHSIPLVKFSTLTNRDSIKFILSALNSKKAEFQIFMPEYNIELKYSDTLIVVDLRQNYIKIDGKPFKVNKNLSDYIASIKKTSP